MAVMVISSSHTSVAVLYPAPALYVTVHRKVVDPVPLAAYWVACHPPAELVSVLVAIRLPVIAVSSHVAPS